ncbi:MAG: DNA polymerase III subunit gamma/tau [Lachnospiraceae bacterium]
MSYTALYRKFRPSEFVEVKGQEAIVTTLKNQITADRIGHAYLFCGTRGTGKTTIAKIFAKAVNCEAPVDGNPCGVCESCRAIAQGSSMNVIEIDAASNNGVENIREIREEVAYSPATGKYKVYIIDEVHMLSIGAFNALLKTLEEPPPYVIFILATTEVHKIPVTILSRCQRYDFKRISVNTITERINELLIAEGVEAEPDAVAYISRMADGALRDALSLLDQCIAFLPGKVLTHESVLQILGAVDTQVFSRLLRNILDEQVNDVIQTVEQLIADGRELSQFVTDFAWYLRNLLLIKNSEGIESVLDVSKESLISLKEEAELLTDETLIRYIRIFSELSNQLKYATQKRILLEVALIKMCRPQMETDVTSLSQRIDKVERKLEKGLITQSAQPISQHIPMPEESVSQKSPVLTKAVPKDVETAVKGFRNIISRMPGLSKSYLSKARLSLGANGDLLIVFDDNMAASYFSREEEKQNLEQVISDYTGHKIEVTVQTTEAERNFEDTHVDLEQIIHMDITYDNEE